jgi:hypothetical protein
VNPLRAGPLTPLGNHIPVLFHQPAFCGHPRRCSTNPRCAAIPGAVRELCGKAGVNSTTLCLPLPYRLHVAPLERGRWNPRKGYDHLPRARPRRRRDVGPAEHVSSVTSGPVWPSRHYAPIPGAAASSPVLCEPGTTEHHHGCRCAASNPPSANSRAGVRTETKREAPVSLPVDGENPST